MLVVYKCVIYVVPPELNVTTLFPATRVLIDIMCTKSTPGSVHLTLTVNFKHSHIFPAWRRSSGSASASARSALWVSHSNDVPLIVSSGCPLWFHQLSCDVSPASGNMSLPKPKRQSYEDRIQAAASQEEFLRASTV
jgi:hypothetical protein